MNQTCNKSMIFYGCNVKHKCFNRTTRQTLAVGGYKSDLTTEFYIIGSQINKNKIRSCDKTQQN